MEIASFEPKVGVEYELQDMTSILRGTFLGFIQNVRKASFAGVEITVPGTGKPLMLFEIIRGRGAPSGYRYAAAHVGIFFDTHRDRVRFTLVADHFGHTIAGIERHGEQPDYFWKLIESR
jgi:hypothetical protein